MEDERELEPEGGGLTESHFREMVSHLAHGIRNPLATIKSGLQLVRHLTKPQGEVADYLESMLDEVARIDQTIRSLQNYVNLRPGSARALDVGAAVGEVVEARAVDGWGKGVEILIRPGPPCRMSIDPGNFRSALGELLTNAVRFSPPGSSVSVSWAENADRRVRIDVDDHGPGVRTENTERILRPFFSTSVNGIGLGLNIVDRICCISGGKLDWQNLPEGGCRFSLSIPEA